MEDHSPPQAPTPTVGSSSNCNSHSNNDDDILQTFLDSLSKSVSSTIHHRATTNNTGTGTSVSSSSSSSMRCYTRDQIDISSIAALEDILRQQSQSQLQQRQQQSHPQGPLVSTTNSRVVVSLDRGDDTGSFSANHPTKEEEGGGRGEEFRQVHEEPQEREQQPLPLPASLTPNERYLYQQIQHNTKLLQDLHQKMDVALSHLSSTAPQVSASSSTSTSVPSFSSFFEAATTDASTSAFASVLTRRSKHHHQSPSPPTATATATSQPPSTTTSTATFRQKLRSIMWENPVTRMIRKILHLYILFYTLNQRYCRHHRQQQQQLRNNNPNQPNNNNVNFDPFMIFKVVFMMAILWSRIQQQHKSSSSSHQKNHHSTDNENDDNNNDDTMHLIFTLQVLLVAAIVVAFFMYRTGQFLFLYLFYYKYRIPQRVLRAPRPDPNHHQNDDNNNDNGGTSTNNNNEDHMITADEIWNEHLAAVAEQEQQRQLQLQQQQQEANNRPLGPDGRRAVDDGNQNTIEQLIQRVRHRMEWLLVHDWFRGEPVAIGAGAGAGTGVAVRTNETPESNNPATTTESSSSPPPPPQVSPITRFVRMILIMIQDIIIFFVSFVLSILPVWRNIDPDALFRVFQQEQEQQQAININNNDDGIPIPNDAAE
jgi:hypothetical protein